MYDPEGYSLWFCNYKYNEENTVSFVTLNKVGGFLQRMDLARKYAFGKMLVIGSEPPFKVKGLWLFRGQEIPQFVIDECYDMELYEWTKVDISDEAQKERASQMIEDCEPFEGEALLDAKCFKWSNLYLLRSCFWLQPFFGSDFVACPRHILKSRLFMIWTIV